MQYLWLQHVPSMSVHSIALTPILERRSVRSDAAMLATMSSRTPAPNSSARGITRPLPSLPCLCVRRCVGVAGGVPASRAAAIAARGVPAGVATPPLAAGGGRERQGASPPILSFPPPLFQLATQS